MNEDFQKRLARLEAKHGPSSAPSYQPPQPPSESSHPSSGGGSGGGGRGGLLKMVLFGLVCLVLLPAGAVFATMHLPQIKDGADRVMAFAEIWQGIGGDGSAEQRTAKREMDGVLLRMSTGTMSAEEYAYWSTDEGNARLRELQLEATQINHDKLKAAAKRLYGVD